MPPCTERLVTRLQALSVVPSSRSSGASSACHVNVLKRIRHTAQLFKMCRQDGACLCAGGDVLLPKHRSLRAKMMWSNTCAASRNDQFLAVVLSKRPGGQSGRLTEAFPHKLLICPLLHETIRCRPADLMQLTWVTAWRQGGCGARDCRVHMSRLWWSTLFLSYCLMCLLS